MLGLWVMLIMELNSFSLPFFVLIPSLEYWSALESSWLVAELGWASPRVPGAEKARGLSGVVGMEG